ncbi:hypothetical protein NHX12_013590 [Muraenolepis orangiensis]|uniref:Uncharacterized protein n=1 Tax=Muraenolepis orangiensis TaxID=630683 RepID=A0A9Q0DDV9_9TELE|nr:hypothetical protein NHX12_013590 [Muraenolepis orangiensis]
MAKLLLRIFLRYWLERELSSANERCAPERSLAELSQSALRPGAHVNEALNNQYNDFDLLPLVAVKN